MRTLLGALLLAAACLPALAASCPKPLRIGFSDVALAPMLMGSGPGFQDPPGWGVQAARDAAAPGLHGRVGAQPGGVCCAAWKSVNWNLPCSSALRRSACAACVSR
jgi:hypothetical protein